MANKTGKETKAQEEETFGILESDEMITERQRKELKDLLSGPVDDSTHEVYDAKEYELELLRRAIEISEQNDDLSDEETLGKEASADKVLELTQEYIKAYEAHEDNREIENLMAELNGTAPLGDASPIASNALLAQLQAQLAEASKLQTAAFKENAQTSLRDSDYARPLPPTPEYADKPLPPTPKDYGDLPEPPKSEDDEPSSPTPG